MESAVIVPFFGILGGLLRGSDRGRALYLKAAGPERGFRQWK
jgi:hypothetical protein